MAMSLILIASFLISLAAVIVLYVLVLPKKKDGTFFSGFWQWVHDYFHFKKLYIESVLRFCFVFATIGSMVFGLFASLYSAISYPEDIGTAIGQFFGLVILLPIGLRLFYELTMMAILLVKNVMEINKKLGQKSKNEAAPPATPTSRPEPAPAPKSYAAPQPSAYAPPRQAVYQPPVQRPTYAPQSAPVKPAPVPSYTAPIPPVAPAPAPVAAPVPAPAPAPVAAPVPAPAPTVDAPAPVAAPAPSNEQ